MPLRRAPTLAVTLLMSGNLAFAQQLMPRSPSIFGTPSGSSLQHLNPLGKPCLIFGGYVEVEGERTVSIFGPPEQPNPTQPGALAPPKIYEHEVRVANSCGQRIKVQICYYKSDHCVKVDVAPWERRDVVLGIFPGLSGFRFEAKENF